MRIKTYEAPTEQEAIEKVKNDLGSGAVILSMKKISPKGLFRFFRKQKYEVTAAMDDGLKKSEASVVRPPAEEAREPEKPYIPVSSENMLKDVKISEQEVKIKTLEQMLNNNEELLKKIVAQVTLSSQTTAPDGAKRFENQTLQLFYETLINNGVTNEIAVELLEDLDTYFDDDDTNISILVKLIYNRIVQKLGEPALIEFENGKPLILLFMGPTGVGKTTTIAKLASQFIIYDKKKVGFITADTYRIAAVEQLKTYADILGVSVEVVYNAADMQRSVEKISPQNDIIFIDTAGRSHKNEENLRELSELVAAVPEAKLFLVLSSTTKYEDLSAIADIYSKTGEYNLILTKIDETGSLGLALNLCCQTGKRLSYLTNGQNVPEDIKIAEPTSIARALLGSTES